MPDAMPPPPPAHHEARTLIPETPPPCVPSYDDAADDGGFEHGTITDPALVGGKANRNVVARLAGTHRIGAVRHAYTLVPTDDGKFIAVHLENVRFEYAHIPHPRGPQRVFIKEKAPQALNRTIAGMRDRANLPGGWSPRKAG